MNSLDEITLSSESVFQGALLHVKSDQVRLQNGHTTQREYIVHCGAACVVAELANGNIVLERQYRYPLRRAFIEIPAGKIDSGETPLATAQRELFEETGYGAQEWQHFMTLHPCIGYSDERIEMYFARGLEAREFERPVEESLEVFDLSLSEAMQWLAEGKITDAKTVIGLLWLQQRRALEKNNPVPISGLT